jgi:hypothetical protein
MATFYLDFYNGNNANNGTTPSTPKLTLSAAGALTSAATDEIRVRGVDSLFTAVGNATWTDESNSVIMTGDTTGSISVGDYICKTIVASGNTVPQLHRVSAISYAAGTNLTTITLTNTTNCYYYGTTETVSTSKIDLTQTMALQAALTKNSPITGTANSWDRIGVMISGGWNSGYTSQNSFTLVYNTANASSFCVLNNSTTARLYWEFSRMIVFNANQNFCVFRLAQSKWDTCAFIGVAAKHDLWNTTGN